MNTYGHEEQLETTLRGSSSVRARWARCHLGNESGRTMKIRNLAAFGLVGSLLLAACGDDDDDAATNEEDETSSAFEAPSEDTEGTLRVWLNANDTPDSMRDWAIEEFNEVYPNVEVQIETQEWDGLVERLSGVLPTEDSPDIVELGNTQAQEFEAAGALIDLSDVREDLGGDDLLDSLAEAGTYNGSFYGLPLYAGARVVTYRTDLFEASGLEVPTTMEELIEAAETLQSDNADVPNFSGFYFPGRNWHAMLSFIWDAGGDIATQNDEGEWVNELGSGESIEGLTTVQNLMQNANQAPADSDDSNDFVEFCNGEIGMLAAPGWKPGQILDPEQGCPETMEGKLGAFPLPGSDGGVAPSFLGGSVLGISSQSENVALANEFLKIISGEGFQTQYAENGLIPARKSLLGEVTGEEAAVAQAQAAEESRFVPSSPNWAEVEGQDILQDMGTAIGSGGDVEEDATRAGEAIVEILNS
jgi:ABC-type glycerol-3-phosphate transport system substrate-binding protein